jgi:preprotein translocase subunit SecA
MLDPILAKIFGTKNEREIKTLRPIIAAINDLEPGLLQLPGPPSQKKTQDFKQRVVAPHPAAA